MEVGKVLVGWILSSFCFHGVFKEIIVVSKLPVFVALLFCLVCFSSLIP